MPRQLPLLLLLAAGALAAAACKKSGDGANGDSTAADSAGEDAPATARLTLPVAAVRVREGDLILTVTTTGQVQSAGIAELKAEVTGTLDSVFVRPGDRVRKGQRLVRFEARPLDLGVQEAEARVAQAQVQYRELYFPDSAVTGRPPTPEQRQTFQAKAGLPAALVALERAKLDRDKGVVLSPFNGIVDRVDAAPGVRVSAGEQLMRVVDLTQLRIEAAVLEHDLPLIKEGGQALVSSAAARDRPITGRISAVLPMVDTVSRSGRAYVWVPGNNVLRPGMYADVRLEATRLTGRRIVPARAIIQRDGRPLVFVVKDGRAQWVYINPGRSNGFETEVLPDSGTGLIPVEVGDEVVVDGHLTLTHDAPVRVIAADTGSMSRGVNKE